MEQGSDIEKDSEEMRRPIRNSYGSLISILLILLVLVAGAYYAGHKRLMEYRTYHAAHPFSK